MADIPKKRNMLLPRTLFILVGLLILLVPLMFMVKFYLIPESWKPYIVNLSGTWDIKEAPENWGNGQVPTAKWNKIKIPGVFYRQGFTNSYYVLRKTVDLKADMLNEDLFFFFSSTRTLTGKIYVNDSYIGDIGSASLNRNSKGIEGTTGLLVPKEIVKPESNTIEILIRQNVLDYDRISDSRQYLGIEKYLRPYYENNETVFRFFQYGFIYLSFFMLLFIITIIVLEGDSPYRKKHFHSAFLVLACMLYNLAISGVFIANLLDPKMLSVTIKITIILLPLAFIDFFVTYSGKGDNLFGKVFMAANRSITAAVFAGYLVFYNNTVMIQKIYDYFILYLFLELLIMLAMSFYSTLFIKRNRFTFLIFMSVFVLCGGAVVGLLNNLGLTDLPLVTFSVALSGSAIISSVVVMTEFIGISTLNKELNASLQELNLNLENKVAERTLELSKKQDQLNRELKVAKKVQTALMPNLDKSQIPEQPEFGALYKSAEDLGGDLYDVFIHDKKSCSIMIADVCGHGVPAALVTFMIKTLFNIYAKENIPLKEMAYKINNKVFELVGDSEQFFSVFLGFWDSDTKILRYSDGGHMPFLIYSKSRNEIVSVKMNGLIMGLFRNTNYNEEEVKLDPGDILLFYTDGIIETRNPSDEMFGIEKLNQFIIDHADLSAADFVKTLEQELTLFSENKIADDDQTLLFMRV